MAIKSLTDFVKENEINMKKKYTTQQIQDITWTNKQKKNLLARYQEPEKQNFLVRSMATVDNLAVNLLKGFVNTTEGAADTFSYLIADVEDFFGADKAAERTRKKTKEDLTSKLFDNRITEAVEGQAYNSKANQIANQIFYGAGNVAAMAGGAQALGGLGMAQAPATITTSFTTAYGNATSEALRNGDDLKTARIKGFINGTAEAISEQMFDALPGMKAYGWGDKVIGNAGSLVKKYFGTNAGKVAMKVFDAAGEGFEEIVSNVLTDVGNDLAHLFDKQNFDLKNPLKEFTNKESWQQFLYASLTSALTNGSNTFINAQQKNAILKGYAKDNNITLDEAKKKFNQAVQEKTEVQKSAMTGTNLKEETELEEENKKKTLSEIVSGTFVEPGTSTQAYQYKTTDNELVNAMNKSITDSNGSNDYKTRTAAELATKIIEDLNVPVLFTNNEQLRSQMSEQQLQDTEGRTINGFVSDDGTMYLNLDSDELASFTVGHETKHFFESNKDMNDVLNKALKEYAVETGVYEKDLEDITKLYTDKNGNLFADPETELMADYVGKFFTDEEFVRNLSVKNPSFFQRIKDYFEKLYLRVTNQKEKLLVKQIKDTINKAYRQYAEMTGGKVAATEERLFNETAEQKKARQRGQTKQQAKQKAVLPEAKNVVEKKENVLPIKEKTQEKPEVKKETKKEIKKVETKKAEKEKGKIKKQEKTTLKEVVDEDLFNIDTKEIENQFDKETYNLNEDDGTEYEIDGTNFRLNDGNILEISTPYTYSKKTLDKIYQNEIDFTVIDENDNVIDEYSIKGKDNTFTKEEIINAIKHMTYDDSNKVANGQIDIFDNVHKNSGIQYSLSHDNKGRELSKEQHEFFKDSKVRDKDGNLLEVYHGTPNGQFNIFEKSYLGETSLADDARLGFHFTDNKVLAEYFSKDLTDNSEVDKPFVMNQYLNIKKPLSYFADYGISEQQLADDLVYISTGEKNVTNVTDVYDNNLEVLSAVQQNFDNARSEMKDLLATREAKERMKELGYDGLILPMTDSDAKTILQSGHEYIIFDSNQAKNVDNKKPTSNPDIRYSLSVKNANTTQDNEGRKLSKDQKQYFADSMAVDENGNLITAYHTMTDLGAQFNVFNPTDTDNYRFGGQVVNFFTNSKTMSGSYADYDYIMADTKKLKNLEDANKWLEKQNNKNKQQGKYVIEQNDDGTYSLLNENDIILRNASMETTPAATFKDENQLLRQLKEKYQNLMIDIGGKNFSNTYKNKYQYEGYLNITNPLIIDAKGQNWDMIATDYDHIAVRYANEIPEDTKQELIDLAKESKQKNEEHWDKLQELLKEQSQLRMKYPFSNSDNFKDFMTSEDYKRYKQLEEEIEVKRKENTFEDTYFRDNVTSIMNKLNEEQNMGYGEYDLFKMADNNFTEEAIKDTFSTKESTNDIVRKALNSDYDGVIIKNVLDYGSGTEFDPMGAAQDVYVTFNSNQFKAVDNENPTEDSDIRYSISREGETRSEKYDDFYKPKVESKIRLSDLKKKEPELPAAEKTKTGKRSLPLVKNQETLRVAAENIAKEINTTGDFDTTKQRGWIESLKNSDAIEDKSFLKDLDFSKLSYQVQTNQKSLDTANDYIKNNGYDNSLNHVKDLIRSEKTPSASDIALMQRMTQEAIKNKDYQTAQDLIMDTAILGTDLGQAVQALSIIKKLTPEGQLKLYTKIVNRAKIRGEKSFKDVEITPKMVENVLGAYNEDGTYDQNDLNARVEEFKQDIAEQMKATVADKVNAWRYLSMLGNPKTHIRNMVSNIAMTATTKVKNAMARTFESILPINERTKTWKQTSAEIKDYAKQTATDMKDIITGENKYNEKVALEQEKQVFKTKALEKVSRFNSAALEAEDWFFSRRAFEKTFSEYLTANGINSMEDVESNPEIIEKAKTYAVEQAEIATFRQYSKLASEISRIERNGKLSKYAINAVLPFKKTPINVAKAGFNYSPLGLIKNVSYDVYQLQKGNINASQFIDNLSQGLTGTSVALLGYALAKAGVLSGSGDDDKEDKYDKQLGGQSYALNIGGKSYSISWLSPTAMPLLVGSNMYEKLEEGKDWSPDVIMDTLAQTLDPMSEMSFLSSLTDTLQSYSNGGLDMIKNMGETSTQSYILQFFPTLLGQMASTFDDTKRSTKVSNNSKFKFGEETMRKIMLKIPGLRNQLEAQTDIWGNEKQQTDNILTRAFESFLAPYSKTEDISTSLDTEIKRVYNKTGEDSVIPGIPQAYIRKDSETYKMSASEYTQYKKTFGQTANQTLNELIKSDSYQQVSDEDKVKMIENVYKYAREQAKQEYFNNEGIDADSKKLDKFNRIQSQYGISASDYYGNMSEYNYADKNPDRHLAIKQIGDYDDYTGYKEQISAIKKSYSNKNDRKNAVFDYINSLPLSIEQKLILQKVGAGYSVKNERARLQRYIESLDLTANEKQRIDKVLFG